MRSVLPMADPARRSNQNAERLSQRITPCSDHRTNFSIYLLDVDD
jgi:hypothetical protein